MIKSSPHPRPYSDKETENPGALDTCTGKILDSWHVSEGHSNSSDAANVL